MKPSRAFELLHEYRLDKIVTSILETEFASELTALGNVAVKFLESRNYATSSKDHRVWAENFSTLAEIAVRKAMTAEDKD